MSISDDSELSGGSTEVAARRILLFVNPIAGRGEGLEIAQALARALLAEGYEVEQMLEAPSAIPADRFAACPLAVIVVGGDGTLRGVVQRLIEVFDPAQLPPVAVVPLGTANLMGKHLAIGWRGDAASTRRVVTAIRGRAIRFVDAGRANGQLFLLMAGVGIDGQVVHELAAVRSGPIDYVSYVLPAALALRRYTYPAIEVTLDGRRRFGPRPGVAFVGNIAEYGTGFPLLPHARSDDGLLDVCALPCASRADAMHLLLRAASGEHLDVEGALYGNARHVRIDSAEQVPVQVDGDAAGHTPLVIELLAVRVPFIVEEVAG